MEPSEIGIFLNKSSRPLLRDQTLCFSAWDRFVSEAATKGWAWCKHNAELVECAAALRHLKLLVGRGDFDFTKGKYVEHGQLKGWKPHFQPTVAKSSISTHCNSMANGKKHVPIFRNKPWRRQLRDQTYASLHETQIQNLGQRDGIFCKHNATIMQRW